jgi:hypothetical protein
MREWRRAKPEKARAIDRRRYAKDPAGRCASSQRARRKRRATALYPRYQAAMQRLRKAIIVPGYQGRGWEAALGYSVFHFRIHLEAHFALGMTWANYGQGEGRWSVDHVRPVSSFAPETPSIREAFALDNLRPRWSTANQEKASQWDGRHWALEAHG